MTEPDTEPAVRSDLDALLAANESFYAAFANHDAEAMAALWSESVEIAVTHPGWMAFHGRAAVMASWRAILGNERQPRVVPGAAQGLIIGEVGIVHCREFAGGAGLVATNIFVREHGEWRMIDHHASAAMMQ